MATQVPFFRVHFNEQEIEEVVATLRSGWLTTGPKVRLLEQRFAEAVGAAHAVAVNSCTAALHLAVESLRLRPGQAVLIPTLTFAATAEVVRYQGGIPVLVDCDAKTSNINLDDAADKIEQLKGGRLQRALPKDCPVVGMIPVHLGGFLIDIGALKKFGCDHNLWVIEDAAHAFPCSWRQGPDHPWQRCGEGTSTVTCFSFYANKTMTTGEGGMAVTNDPEIAERMRLMSLHGLSRDAWSRYSSGGSWDYRIVAPGYKYNLTDIAAALGIHQLARAEQMRQGRESIANHYIESWAQVEQIELPLNDSNHIHSWHLFPIRLRLERLEISRNEFIEELKRSGVATTVHYRPLHLHPYYQDTFGWRPEDFPVATELWERLVSIPIFSGMTDEEIEHVTATVKTLCERYSRTKTSGRAYRLRTRRESGRSIPYAQ